MANKIHHSQYNHTKLRETKRTQTLATNTSATIGVFPVTNANKLTNKSKFGIFFVHSKTKEMRSRNVET